MIAARGIGRVSMGIETLSDEVLVCVNRQHGGATPWDARERLVASGLIVNIDFDLRVARETEDIFRRDFEAVAQVRRPFGDRG